MKPREIKTGSAKFTIFNWSMTVELKSQPGFLHVKPI